MSTIGRSNAEGTNWEVDVVEKKISLVIQTYDAPMTAGQVAEAMEAVEREEEGVIGILNVAVLVMEADGKVMVREREDVDTQHGALLGAIVGGLIGLLGGPAGIAVGSVAGAVVGGAAAHALDMGFLNEYLQMVKADLRPGTSALVALVEQAGVERFLEELGRFEGGTSCQVRVLPTDVGKSSKLTT